MNILYFRKIFYSINFLLITIIITPNFAYESRNDLQKTRYNNSWQYLQGLSQELSTVVEKCLDNEYIQTYKNKKGIWIELKKKKEVQQVLKQYQANQVEFNSINNFDPSEKYFRQKFYFIPFSEQYISFLEEDNITQFCIEHNQNHYLWPIQGVRVSSRLGKRWGRQHSGLDIATSIGTLVISSASGVVRHAGYSGALGKTVVVDKEDYTYIYAHLEHIYIRKGDVVQPGQAIALSGNSGISTGPHLHFEVRYKNIVINPEDYLNDFETTKELIAQHEASFNKHVVFNRDLQTSSNN